MRIVIDRFEKDIAIAEKDDGSTAVISKKLLNDDCSEGDVYEIVFLPSATSARRKKIKARMVSLLKKN